MWTITPRDIAISVLVLITWIFGSWGLYEILSDFSTMWPWYIAATFYTILVNELFTHQICAHSAIEVDPNRWTYKILMFLATVDHGFAPVTGYCKYHENHHLYADDGDKDNLNWRYHWYNLCMLSPITFLYVRRTNYPDFKNYLEEQKAKHSTILDDLWTFFVEENRVILTVVYWALLWMIAPAFLFYVVLTGRFLYTIFVTISAIGGHTKLPFGYRNYNTPDESHNNLLFHYICLGLMPSQLQNNHHGNCAKYSSHWYEIDLGGPVINLLRPLLTKKQPL
jgi:fatty-acid desaturase